MSESLTRRPFHELQALAEERGRSFDGIFILKADGLAQEDAIVAKDREIAALREALVGFLCVVHRSGALKADEDCSGVVVMRDTLRCRAARAALGGDS